MEVALQVASVRSINGTDEITVGNTEPVMKRDSAKCFVMAFHWKVTKVTG